MNLLGEKSCLKCQENIGALQVLKVSLGNKEIQCQSCGEPFAFSRTRKWVAIIAVIMIVFAPASHSIFEALPMVTSGIAFLIKYAVSIILFILINGRE